MKMVNIGCGRNYHKDWVNLDLTSNTPDIIKYDVVKGLPFSDETFDAVYSSHMIEHLDPHDAEKFLQNAYRILKPGGIIRIVVPDLERIVTTYIEKLNYALINEEVYKYDYQWIKLELIDQMVRSKPGGGMIDYLCQANIPNKEFIVSRIGREAEQFWAPQHSPSAKKEKKEKKEIGIIFVSFLIKLFGGPGIQKIFNETLFRSSGETHKWMHDRYSLKLLLEQTGFKVVQKYNAHESRIKNFSSYDLDTQNGEIIKPDSLFMEGLK